MMFNMKIALLAFGLVLLAIKDVNADDCGWQAEYAKKFLACRNTCSHDAMNALVKKGGMSGDDAQNIESCCILKCEPQGKLGIAPVCTKYLQ